MDQGANGIASGGDTKKPPFGFTFTRGATSSQVSIQMPDQTNGGVGAARSSLVPADDRRRQGERPLNDDDDEDDDARTLR